jgi:mycothiol synthase
LPTVEDVDQLMDVSNLVQRPATVADAAALASLLNAVDVAAGGDPFTTEAEQRSSLSGLVRDLERNSRLLVAPDGTVIAFACLVLPPSGGPRVSSPGAVLPEWRGKGIGRSLMSWQVARAQEAYAETEPGIDWHLQSGALVANEPAVRLLEQSGFQRARYFLDMEAPTGAGHESPIPDGLRMQAYAPELEDDIYEAHVETFQDHWGFQPREKAQWQSITTRSESLRPDLSRIVLDGNRVAAYLVAQDGQPGELYIDLVGTRREYRRRGLATAMLGDVLAAASKASFNVAHLGVDADSQTGAVGVYERAGFSVRSRWASYERPLNLE